MKKGILLTLSFIFSTLTSFAQTQQEDFVNAINKHLNAVSKRDLPTLESTLSPEGDMLLILPQMEMLTTVAEFMEFHVNWFEGKSWTLENDVIKTEIGSDLGIAIVNSTYREPERDGKPYFNRMVISYTLKLIDGKWYVIKDHMCSIEKSTD